MINIKALENTQVHWFPVKRPPCVCSVALVMSDSLQSHGLQSVRLLCPWNSPGKNTGVGSHSLLQGIFLIQGLNQVSCTASRFFLPSEPIIYNLLDMGFPDASSGKDSTCQCRRHKRLRKHGLNLRVGKIPWSEKWYPTLVSSPGKFHRQRSLPWDHRVGHDRSHQHHT